MYQVIQDAKSFFRQAMTWEEEQSIMILSNIFIFPVSIPLTWDVHTWRSYRGNKRNAMIGATWDVSPTLSVCWDFSNHPNESCLTGEMVVISEEEESYV
jgi:hypothetical protein